MLAEKKGKNHKKAEAEQTPASGICADGYDEALSIITAITDQIYKETADADIRRFILDRQEEYEKAGR